MDFSANYNYSGEIYKAMRKVVKLAAPEMFPYNSSYKTYKFGTKKVKEGKMASVPCNNHKKEEKSCKTCNTGNASL